MSQAATDGEAMMIGQRDDPLSPFGPMTGRSVITTVNSAPTNRRGVTSHLANAAWCRRRRSLWSGPAFVALAIVGLGWGSRSTWASWDNVWMTAFIVWLGCYAHDRRRPHRRYRRRRVIVPFATGR
jgi:hypothetical protein